MKFDWDPEKNRTNQLDHGISFEEAQVLFESGVDYLDLPDDEHSDEEPRSRAIGGKITMTKTKGTKGKEVNTSDIPELTEADFARAIRHSTLLRLRAGDIKSGEDIAAFRRFVGMSQPEFAHAMEISLGTLRGWEQGRRKPEGPAMALLKMVARHPRLIRENLKRIEKSAVA